MVLFREMRSARSPRRRTDDKKPAAYKSSPLMRRAKKKQRTLRLRRQRTEKKHVPEDDVQDVVENEVQVEQWTVVSPLRTPPQHHAQPHAMRRVWDFLTSLFFYSKN